MDYRKILLVAVSLINCWTIQTKIYKIRNKKTRKLKQFVAKDASDIVILLDPRKNRFDTEKLLVITEQFRETVEQEEIIIANGGLIRQMIIGRKGSYTRLPEKYETFIYKLFGGDWNVYQTGNGAIGLFVNRKTYQHAIDENEILDLERIGLNGEMKPVFFGKQNIDEGEKNLETTFKFEKEKNAVNIDALNNIWAKSPTGKKIRTKIFMAGHGYYETNPLQAKIAAFKEARVSGMKITSFARVLEKIMETGCQFLFLRSCYAMGLNQLVFDKDIPFAIAADNYPDRPSYGSIEKYFRRPSSKLKKFFLQIQLFLTEQVDLVGGWKKWVERRPLLDRKPFQKIFLTLLRKRKKNIPSIRLPGKNVFRIIPLQKNTTVISYPDLLALEIKKGRGTPILIDNTVKNVILSMDIVPLPIEMTNSIQSVVQFIPMIFGPSHYFLKSLTWKSETISGKQEKSDLGLLISGFVNETPFPKLFFIKNITLKNHKKIGKDFPMFPFDLPDGSTITLANVTIKSVDTKLFGIKTVVICKHGKTYYYATYRERPEKDERGAYISYSQKEEWLPVQFYNFYSNTKAKSKILEWVKETAPFKIALQKVTVVGKEKRFKKLVRKTLKSDFSEKRQVEKKKKN